MSKLFRNFTILCLALTAAWSTAGAQGAAATATSPRGEVRGKVVSSTTKAPVSVARVEASLVGGSEIVARASAGPDGTFRLRALNPGTYVVRVVALGYAAKLLPRVALGSNAPTVEVGTITLTPVAVDLQTVTVRDKVDAVELSPDKNAYVVKDMPTTRGGNALDVLKNVPAVDVDLDNIVSLRGNTGVTIQINGRPSPLKPQQLGNFLSQLPASMVETVEIVSNPSARDDPTGVVGIINLVMKQETDAGTNGGVTVSGSTTGTANVGGNIGYQRGAWSLFGSYGLLRDNRPRHESLQRDNLYSSPITYLYETGLRTQEPLAHTLTGTASFTPTKKDEFTGEVVYSTRRQEESYLLNYSDLNASRQVTAMRDRLSSGIGHENQFEGALAFKHQFAEKGHRITSDLRLTRGEEGGPTAVTARSLGLNGAPTTLTAQEDATTWEHPSDAYLKVDYARLFNGHIRFESGVKAAVNDIHTTLDTRVFDTAQKVFVADSSRINNFTYHQVVNAAYSMVSATSGEFVFQGGVRIEDAQTRFRLRTLNSTYDNHYQSAFPSGLIVYNPQEGLQFKVSYSARINRPDDTDVLDPTIHYQDPLNLSQGNPYLKPEYIHAFELGFQRTTKRTTLQLTPFFRRTNDAVRNIRTIDNKGVTTRTYANISTSDSYGADFTYALKGGALTGFVGASGYGINSNAANVGTTVLSLHTFGWRSRANIAYRFSATVDAQAILSYQPEVNIEQGRNFSRSQLNLAARKKLFDDQLSITLRVIDPFNLTHEGGITSDPSFYQVSDRKRTVRGLALAINWMFGKPDKEANGDLLSGAQP